MPVLLAWGGPSYGFVVTFGVFGIAFLVAAAAAFALPEQRGKVID